MYDILIISFVVAYCIIISANNWSSPFFGKASTPAQARTGLGPKVYFFTTPECLLPGSDAGGDVLKPSSSFVIQKRQTSCSMRCPMYGPRYYNVVCGLFRDAAIAIR